MSQESQHGKWTLSSSDEEDSALVQSRTQYSSSDNIRQTDKLLEAKDELDLFPLSPGSEAGQASSLWEPVKTESPGASGEMYLALKRKTEPEDSGWALSSSDEGSDSEPESQKQTKTCLPSPKRVKLDEESSVPERVPLASCEPEVDETLDTWDVLQGSEPFCFYLTKVTGIERKYNVGALNIKDILSPLFGTLKESVQFNYCVDVHWLVKQYPPEFRHTPVTIVHGEKRGFKNRLQQEADAYDHVHLCQAKLDIAFGTHHTKLMLLLYEEGFRIVIHTANLFAADWYQKTQGIWMSPLYPKLPEGSPASAGESRTQFKHDIIEYLEAYRSPTLNEWADRIKEHDLSETRVHLIGSTPGRYQGANMKKWGHLKLRKLLSENTQPIPNAESWPVVGQFSSIGSMGWEKNKWLASEFQSSLSTLGNGKKKALCPESPLHLVYPTVENVRTSLEGYPAGGSLPYSIQTAQKQLWLHSYFHKWSAEVTGRSHAMPHIKTYMRISPDFKELAWFLVTSANLSKAAWGTMEKNNTQMTVRSYELGVLFLPSAFNMSRFPIERSPFPSSKSPSASFTVPFDLPPVHYSSKGNPHTFPCHPAAQRIPLNCLICHTDPHGTPLNCHPVPHWSPLNHHPVPHGTPLNHRTPLNPGTPINHRTPLNHRPDPHGTPLNHRTPLSRRPEPHGTPLSRRPEPHRTPLNHHLATHRTPLNHHPVPNGTPLNHHLATHRTAPEWSPDELPPLFAKRVG